MKKLISLLLTAIIVFSFVSFAEEAAPVVYVSITDDTGALVLAYAPVAMSDADADGALTIGDALTLAHAEYHEAGADAFSCVPTEYGLSLMKLWNVENGGSYGYCLNNASAMSLSDAVQAGDHVKVYAYTDLDTWSDTYSYFSSDTLSAVKGSEITLTLSANGYDASWNPVTFPVSGANITVNGEATEIITGEDGAFTLVLSEAGAYVISASGSDMTLVTPVCIIEITEG